MAHHRERGQGARVQGQSEQAVRNLNPRVQHDRQIAAAEDSGSEEHPEPHVPSDASNQRDRESRQGYHGRAPQDARGARRRRWDLAPSSHDPPSQQSDTGRHLEQEDLTFQRGHDGGQIAEQIGQEQEPQQIEMRRDLRSGPEARDPQRGQEDQDSDHGRRRAGQRGRVDPDAHQEREDERR